MDVKAFPALIVGVVVALVLAGAVLPVFAETTSATDTFDNSKNSIAYYDLVDLSGDNSINIFWDHTKPTKITVNDVEFDLPDVTNYINGVSLIVSDGMALRYYVQSGARYYVQSIGVGTAGAYGYASTVNNTDVSITLDSDGWTYNKTTPVTAPLTGSVFVISDSGDYVMKTPDSSAYVLEDSITSALGVTVISGTWVIMGWNANTGANITPSEYYPPDGYTITNAVIDSAEVNNYEGLYTLDKVTFTATNAEDDTISATVTYSYFIVPSEVTAEKSVHPDGPLTVILNVLPLLAIAGLVTGAVVWFINRKG